MSEPKDRWDKLEVLLKPIGSIVAGILVAVIGFLGRDYLGERTRIEANSRLLAELISSRESSESELRKDMFGQILKTFLTSSSDLARDVLNLEILAYNFHEALDLSPLFKAVHADIRDRLIKPDGTKQAGSDSEGGSPPVKLTKDQLKKLLRRLERVARDVIHKQISALEDGQNFSERDVDIRDMIENDTDGPLPVIENWELGDYVFNLEILQMDQEKKEVEVKLTAGPRKESTGQNNIDPIFKVGFFDFPMIDNTRLSGGQRCAVVLKSFSDEGFAKLELIIFPGSRASLKDRPYYEEVISQLLAISSVTNPDEPVTNPDESE